MQPEPAHVQQQQPLREEPEKLGRAVGERGEWGVEQEQRGSDGGFADGQVGVIAEVAVFGWIALAPDEMVRIDVVLEETNAGDAVAEIDGAACGDIGEVDAEAEEKREGEEELAQEREGAIHGPLREAKRGADGEQTLSEEDDVLWLRVYDRRGDTQHILLIRSAVIDRCYNGSCTVARSAMATTEEDIRR